jgi:nucleoid-associated protein YgaU
MPLAGPDSSTLGCIIELEGDDKKGWKETGKVVKFQFNPEKIGLQLSTSQAGGSSPFAANQTQHAPQGARHPGTQSGAGGSPQHSGRAAATTGTKTPKLVLSEIYFDGGFTNSVAKDVMQLWDWMYPPQGSDQKKPVPQNPKVRFKLGSTTWTDGRLSNLVVSYTLFTPKGKPTRANVTISIDCDSSDKLPRQNPTSGGIASYSAATLSAGDSLQSIAYKTYGHARLWRQLAAINSIDDPLRVRPGTMVMLPTLNEVLASE